MTEVTPDELREAVESQHGGKATVITGVEVMERFQGEIAWQGVVYVFAMEDQPQGATRAYAWSHSLDDSDRRRFVTVLGVGPIKSANDAVKAAIVAEHRAKG